MAVEIQQFHDDEILVNNKLVSKDMDGQWVAKIELTTSETQALLLHISPIKTKDERT